MAAEQNKSLYGQIGWTNWMDQLDGQVGQETCKITTQRENGELLSDITDC